jgi:fructose-bisphosphate aldolase class II
MPIATTDQYASMLDAAAEDGHALAAVNVTSFATLTGVLRGLAEAHADGIVQITTGAAAFLSGPARDMAAGARAFAYYAHAVAERSPVLIALHTDHAPPERFDAFARPLIEESKRRDSRPLFNSHMFDGSSFPLDKNLRRARELLDELVFTNYGGVLKTDGGVGLKAAYDPRSWGAKAEAALAQRVAAATESFGSAGKSLLR